MEEMAFLVEGTAEAEHERRVLFTGEDSATGLEQKGHWAE